MVLYQDKSLRINLAKRASSLLNRQYMTTSSKGRKILRKIFRITLVTALILVGVLILVILLIQTGPVQNFGRRKLEAYLENKLRTKVRIGNLYIDFPSKVVLKNIYLEDRGKDTLLSGGRIEADISMFRLLHNEIKLDALELDGVTIKVKRLLPDSVFNFQFVADAFSSTDKTPPVSKDSSGGFKYIVGPLHLHNIRAVYKDDATGNDLWLNLADFTARFKTIDPDKKKYEIPEIALRGITGEVKQYKPKLLLPVTPDTPVGTTAGSPIQLQLGRIGLDQIALRYNSRPDSMDASLRLGHFETIADSIDLATLKIKLKKITLDSTVAQIHLGKKAPAAAAGPKTTPEAVKAAVKNAPAWMMDLAAFDADNTRLQYRDDSKPPVKSGFDYSNIDINHLQVHAGKIHADPANYSADLQQLAFDDRSGLKLKRLSAKASYGDNGILLNNLVLITDRSEIRTQADIHYASLESFSKNPGLAKMDLSFGHSRIAIKDLLLFVPAMAQQLKEYETATLLLNGKVSGYLNNLQIPYLQLSGLGNTSLATSGRIKGLPDGKKAIYDLNISKLQSSRTDLLHFIPAGSMPSSIQLPSSLALTGRFTGSVSDFRVLLHLVTSDGNADVAGTMDTDRKLYDLKASTKKLNLGYLLKQDSLIGLVTMQATARGSGFDPKIMSSDFHVLLQDASIRRYAYRGLSLDASLKAGNAVVKSQMSDPNLTYNLDAEGRFMDKFPAVKLNLNLDTADLLALHFLSDTLQLHLKTNADFASTNPDSLIGLLTVNDIRLTKSGKSMHSDSISMAAAQSDSGQHIALRSEMADVDWNGRYKLTQVGDAVQQVINRYYRLPGADSLKKTDPQNWTMTLQLRPSPLVLDLMPSLRGTDSLEGKIVFNDAESLFNINIADPKVQLGEQVIHDLQLVTSTADSAMNYALTMKDAGKKGFQLYESSVSGRLENNKLFTTLELKDRSAKKRYVLSGQASQVATGIRFAFDPDSLLLNYDKWQIPNQNYVQYDSSGVLVHALTLQHGNESLSLGNRQETASSPLDVAFKGFQIGTLTDFAEQDSLLVSGVINGKAEVRDLMKSPVFTSDLTISDLAYKSDTVGNLALNVSNETANAFLAHIGLTGRDNDVQIDGKYFTGESKMDIAVKLNQLNLAGFKTIAAGNVTDMKGYLKGALTATGSIDQPVLTGALHFDSAMITPTITGEPLSLGTDSIVFDHEGFNFSMFTLVDSAGNKATLDGNAFTTDFKNYKFDMSFAADNFQLINAPREPNRLFYGKMNISARVDLTGNQDLPRISSYLRINKNTDFTYVLPSNDPEIVDRQGVVIFTDNKHPVDTLQMKRFLDSLATHASLHGIDASATIETDSSAQLTMVIDERNGDALSMRGRAELVGGIDKSGKTSLTGTYQLDNGSYNLTLSVLHRNFQIQPGSTITWTGDPTKANIDITAIYTVNTPSIDLVEQQLAGRGTAEVNRFKQKLPFQVKLHLTGELLKPVVGFDIALPENQLALWPEVDQKLQQLRTDDAETNKQVFALLLLGRFITENPFESAAGGTNANSIARQSVSKVLSDQLNQLAGSLIKGVNIDFDLNSSEDYSTGNLKNQTELNVNFSKSLFSDRVNVSVGSNFQLEDTDPNQSASTIAGNVNVDYRLSKDGRYMIRVYRRDQYVSVVEGQVVETGLSFILTFDYDSFPELFRNTKPLPKQQTRIPASSNKKSSKP